MEKEPTGEQPTEKDVDDIISNLTPEEIEKGRREIEEYAMMPPEERFKGDSVFVLEKVLSELEITSSEGELSENAKGTMDWLKTEIERRKNSRKK